MSTTTTSSTISNNTLLQLNGLTTHFFTEKGEVHAIDNINLTIERGKTLGIVGESGSGKSVLALSILRLIDAPGNIIAGEIWFDGHDIRTLSNNQMRHIRGNRISMIFQQPTSYLNPVFRVGSQISEVLRIHRAMNRQQARAETIRLLGLVGLPDPERRVDQYPHQLSGGQCQRVMIAMALACEPELLIADEPTTALDVTIQAQILDLMRSLQTQFNTAIMLITHDMGIVADMADMVAVMYGGQVVEYADVYTLFAKPLHPYTRGLLASIPILGHAQDELAVIRGTVPELISPPPGCRFAERCDQRFARCDTDPPICQRPTDTHTPHTVRCWLYDDKNEETHHVA